MLRTSTQVPFLTRDELCRVFGLEQDQDQVRVFAKRVGGGFGGGRMFVHAHSDLYALVTPVTRIIRDLSVDQPVERAATLEDIRAEVLAPDRLNALVFGGFAAVALAIAVVGVAGVLAFSVSGRTRKRPETEE